MNYNQTVTNWIVRLGDGDENAIEIMFAKYFERLIHLAVRKMHGMNQAPRSGEDVAISAVKSFCAGLKNKKIEVTSEDDLWGCLFRITTRKACAERRRAFSAKRGRNATLRQSDMTDEDQNDLFQAVAGREPSPELAMEMAETADELLAVFDDQPTQRQIIELKLGGFSNQEIAERTGLVLRTVFWHLKNIQTKWTFIKSMEFLIENLFAGSPLDDLAQSLDWPNETVRQAVEKMLALWRDETGDDDGAKMLALKFFHSREYEAKRSARDETVERLERSMAKTADSWKERVRTAWKSELRRLTEKRAADNNVREGHGE